MNSFIISIGELVAGSIRTVRLSSPLCCNAHSAVGDDQPTMRKPGDRLRQDSMLLGQHARGERFLIVGIEDRHRGLRDDRAMV